MGTPHLAIWPSGTHLCTPFPLPTAPLQPPVCPLALAHSLSHTRGSGNPSHKGQPLQASPEYKQDIPFSYTLPKTARHTVQRVPSLLASFAYQTHSTPYVYPFAPEYSHTQLKCAHTSRSRSTNNRGTYNPSLTDRRVSGKTARWCDRTIRGGRPKNPELHSHKLLPFRKCYHSCNCIHLSHTPAPLYTVPQALHLYSPLVHTPLILTIQAVLRHCYNGQTLWQKQLLRIKHISPPVLLCICKHASPDSRAVLHISRALPT